MATHESHSIHGSDLRRLLDSDLADAVLILVGGHLEVVSGGDQEDSGLEIISRSQLVQRTGKFDFSDEELEQHASELTATVSNLGG